MVLPPPPLTRADADYQAFLKLLEEGPEAMPSALAQLERKEAEASRAPASEGSSSVVTPLMQYLQDKYSKNPGLRLGAFRNRRKGRNENDMLEVKVSCTSCALSWRFFSVGGSLCQ